jgi:hypothetical protein
MRDLLEKVTRAAELPRDGSLDRSVHIDLLAHILAVHAVTAAASQGETIAPGEARRWIDAVAGYPGILFETLTSIDGVERTAGQRAEEVIAHMLEIAVWKG